ncbi:MAG: FG-GAP repeat protein [Granulosicoccus sp.]|nr:FG-GAP repeat protein [Granulosicoccus sp.]
MNAATKSLSRLFVSLIVGAMLVSGCSKSDGPQLAAESVADATEGEYPVADDGAPDAANQTEQQPAGDSEQHTHGSSNDSVTRIEFDITVPAYRSNALQVRVIWGEKDLTAMWVVDETWTVSDDFPTDTENQLIVIFSDNNGSITLASFETQFDTGSSNSQTYRITAEQFDTDRWDDDSDGISNLDELRAEHNSDPTGPVTGTGVGLLPVSASVELRVDKTFRISWGQNNAAEFFRVLENPDGVSGYTDVSGELDASTEYYDHRVALHKRFNARYIVEACNASGCVASAQQLIEGTLDAAIGYFKASNTGEYNYFGRALSVSADGKTLAVGAPDESSAASGINGSQNNDGAYDTGAVYVFAHSESGWQQQAYIKASNSDQNDYFGDVVSLSSDGSTLAVGAPGEKSSAIGINGDQNDNTAGSGSGAVYVFTRSNGDWTQQAYLKASNNRGEDFAGTGEGFGDEISLSADGNTLAVGAPYEDSSGTGINGNQIQDNDPYTRNTGAVYIFQRSNGAWYQHTYLKAVNHQSNGYFGHAISLSADGNNLAVSVYYNENEERYSNADAMPATDRGADYRDFFGAVYVYVRTDESWSQQAFLRSGTDTWSGFAEELSLSGDGSLLAVSDRELVQMFEYIGGAWEHKANLKPSDDRGKYGLYPLVSLSADGSTLAIGVPVQDSGSTGIEGYQGDGLSKRDSGAVYVFTRPDGIWQQLAFVKASNSQPGINFGSSISFSANGDTMAIGAPKEASATIGINGDQNSDPTAAPAAGAVYLY